MSAFFGQVVINTDNNGLTVDSTPATLTSGTWYTWHDTDGSSLCDHLAAMITADASSATVTASVSSDGILTLTGTDDFDVEDFEAYDLFGFASEDLTGASSYTATKRLEASWFPGRDPSGEAAPVSEQGVPRALVAQSQAADGTTYTTEIGSLTAQTLPYQYVSKAKAWTDDGNRSAFVTWFADLRDGRKILFVPDWTGSGSYSTQHEYVYDLKGHPQPDIKRQQQTRATDLYWTVTLHLRGV